MIFEYLLRTDKTRKKKNADSFGEEGGERSELLRDYDREDLVMILARELGRDVIMKEKVFG